MLASESLHSHQRYICRRKMGGIVKFQHYQENFIHLEISTFCRCIFIRLLEFRKNSKGGRCLAVKIAYIEW